MDIFYTKGLEGNATIEIISNPDERTHVTVTLNINSSGQLVTKKENEFWQHELNDLEQALQTGCVDVNTSIKKARVSLHFASEELSHNPLHVVNPLLLVC